MDVRSILTISLAIRIYNMISAVEKKRKKCYDALIKESDNHWIRSRNVIQILPTKSVSRILSGRQLRVIENSKLDF
jgi:hypothetical protein